MSKLTSFLSPKQPNDEYPSSLETYLMDDGTKIGPFADRIGDELPAGADVAPEELTTAGAQGEVASALDGADVGWQLYSEVDDAALPYHSNVKQGNLVEGAEIHQETEADRKLRLVMGSRAAEVVKVRRAALGGFNSDQPSLLKSGHVPNNLTYDSEISRNNLELAA